MFYSIVIGSKVEGTVSIDVDTIALITRLLTKVYNDIFDENVCINEKLFLIANYLLLITNFLF